MSKNSRFTFPKKGIKYLRQGLTYGMRSLSAIKRQSIANLNKFIVFAQGRSGSTLLIDLLNQHPDIKADPEIFNIDLYGKIAFPRPYLQGRLTLAAYQRKKCYGFKVKPYQLTNDQQLTNALTFIKEQHQAGFKIIHLQRQNVFRQALSSVLAETTNVWHIHQKAPLSPAMPLIHPTNKINVSPTDLLAKMRERQQYQHLEATMLQNVPHLFLSYEQHLYNAQQQTAAMPLIFDFLEVNKEIIVESNLQKITTTDWQKHVLNVEVVEKAVQKAGYAHFLSP